MASARGGGRSTVRRRLAVLVAANFVVLVAVSVAGIVGTMRAHDSVHYLSERLEPAARVNADALQDLTDAETYIWGYVLTGRRSLLDQYRQARDSFEGHRSQLRGLRSLDGPLGARVDDFLAAGDTWVRSYADRRAEEPAGLETFDPDRFARSGLLFDRIRETNTAAANRIGQLSDDAESSVQSVETSLLVVLAAVFVAGAAGSLLVASRVGRGVTEPLADLERTARRLGSGDHAARARVRGPREVVQVATAVNRMAAENDRARQVEARVVEQLRALDAVKSDFVSNVSHELRTPLTSILGYLELLEEEVEDHAEESELAIIDAAKRNVLRLGELIDDLLALTRSESQTSELVPLDLALLTRDVVTDLRVASSQQGVEIRLGLPGGLVPVQADAGQMTRVVTNLVSNAVKFSQGAAEVVVTVVADDEYAVLGVEDHGIGIPAQELDQLGSRFYRASNAVGLGITGTGLGLRIVQAIVENHHGSIDLRSELGVGTTVWVRLPLHRPDAAPPDARRPSSPAEVVGPAESVG